MDAGRRRRETMTSRYISMSIPKSEEEGGAFWFVFDTKTRKTVAEVSSYDEAKARASECNRNAK